MTPSNIEVLEENRNASTLAVAGLTPAKLTRIPKTEITDAAMARRMECVMRSEREYINGGVSIERYFATDSVASVEEEADGARVSLAHTADLQGAV